MSNVTIRHRDTFPDIEISEGWSISDVKTIQDCDEAFAHLTETVASIEAQLTVAKAQAANGVYSPPVWFAKANAALKFKRAALQLVQNKRGQLNAEARRRRAESAAQFLLDIIKAQHPDVFHQALAQARLERPEDFA